MTDAAAEYAQLTVELRELVVATKNVKRRPRDSQRSKVYQADEALKPFNSQAGLTMLAAPRLTTSNVSIPACQAYVDMVLDAPWFTEQWDVQAVEVRHKTSGRATARSTSVGGVITLPPWARREYVILHELAHVVQPRGSASHGPEFAGHLLMLAKRQLGPPVAACLERAYRQQRVRWVEL